MTDEMPQLLTMSMFATKADLEAAKAAQKAKYAEDCIIVRALVAGYQVVQFKTGGLAKGETVLASLCAGNMGKVLAVTVAKQAMVMTMIDKLVSEV